MHLIFDLFYILLRYKLYITFLPFQDKNFKKNSSELNFQAFSKYYETSLLKDIFEVSIRYLKKEILYSGGLIEIIKGNQRFDGNRP